MINENSNNISEKDEFQCLFQEIYDNIDIHKLKNGKKIMDNIKKSVENFQKDTKDKKTNLVIIGDYNSGKTTCCNSLIASLINEDKCKSWSNIGDFLPWAIVENTYYITVVECSNSCDFSLEHFEDEKLIKSITTRADQVENIKEYLYELDDKSDEKLREISRLEENRLEVPDLKDKFPMTVILIKIPQFSKELRIIDTPSLSTRILSDVCFEFLQKKGLVNIIFLILRNSHHRIVYDKGFKLAINNIVNSYPNSLSILLLTQIDEIIHEESKRLKMCQSELKRFLTFFGDKSKSLNYIGTFFVSCREALKDNEIYKKGMIKLKLKLIGVIIHKLKYCFKEYYSFMSEPENCFTSDEVNIIQTASVKSCEKYQESFKTWVEIENKEYENFEKNI